MKTFYKVVGVLAGIVLVIVGLWCYPPARRWIKIQLVKLGLMECPYKDQPAQPVIPGVSSPAPSSKPAIDGCCCMDD